VRSGSQSRLTFHSIEAGFEAPYPPFFMKIVEEFSYVTGSDMELFCSLLGMLNIFHMS
jgi:hypothetical protein